MELGLESTDLQGKRFAYGKGCNRCNATGYKGRTAIFEMLVLSDILRKMILDGESADELRAQGQREGMQTLRASGLVAVFEGRTTVEEVIRESISI